MRTILLFIAAFLLAPTLARAQASPAKDFKALFETVQALGTQTELRGDISDRLGFGDEALPIMDLVVTKDGVQHALNAFVVSNKPYILFNSHLYIPEVYMFVKSTGGDLVAGVHGRQYRPITSTIDMTPAETVQVTSAEEAFWFQWLADGAKLPAPVN